MNKTYEELNKLSMAEIQKIRHEILDKFMQEEKERQIAISDVLRLQALGSLWAMNNSMNKKE